MITNPEGTPNKRKPEKPYNRTTQKELCGRIPNTGEKVRRFIYS